jgi:hypothetical protein
LLLAAGKRWFAELGSGRPVALGSLLALGQTALIDHVVTCPAGGAAVRGCDRPPPVRGDTVAGARTSCLLTDPDGDG